MLFRSFVATIDQSSLVRSFITIDVEQLKHPSHSNTNKSFRKKSSRSLFFSKRGGQIANDYSVRNSFHPNFSAPKLPLILITMEFCRSVHCVVWQQCNPGWQQAGITFFQGLFNQMHLWKQSSSFLAFSSAHCKTVHTVVCQKSNFYSCWGMSDWWFPLVPFSPLVCNVSIFGIILFDFDVLCDILVAGIWNPRKDIEFEILKGSKIFSHEYLWEDSVWVPQANIIYSLYCETEIPSHELLKNEK